MSESSLSVGLPELREAVAYYLGYGRTAFLSVSAQLSEVDGIIQSGMRRVYYPPAVSADTVGYEWSWLRPTTTIPTVAGTGDYDLPDDFGRLVGCLHYPESEHRKSISIVSVGKLLAMRSYSSQDGPPRCAAVRYKVQDPITGQRQEILFYPEPDAAWILSYEYEAYSGALTTANPYPLGGMKYSELYIESCLAVAESHIEDQADGTHKRQYEALLVDAIARDRKNGAHVFGPMGNPEAETRQWHRGDTGSTYPITYKGVTL